MKKLFILLASSLVLVSCSTTTKTARTEVLPYAMYNATVADLDVAAERIVYTYTPNKAVWRAGVENCKRAAIQEALSQFGNADLLVEPMFVITKYDGLFSHKITSVTVSGRPAKYINFHSLGDDVWTDPVFRNVKGASYQFIEKKGENCEPCK